MNDAIPFNQQVTAVLYVLFQRSGKKVLPNGLPISRLNVAW